MIKETIDPRTKLAPFKKVQVEIKISSCRPVFLEGQLMSIVCTNSFHLHSIRLSIGKTKRLPLFVQ